MATQHKAKCLFISGNSQLCVDVSERNALVENERERLAIGAVLLCVGSVVAAVIIAIGYLLGKIEGSAAERIILGCVGGGAISGVVAAISRNWKKSEKKSKS